MIDCCLCGSNKTVKINTKIRNSVNPVSRIYECKNCQVHFLYPKPTTDELEEYYDGKYRREYCDSNFYDVNIQQKFYLDSLPEAKLRVNRVEQFLKDSDNVLEIGCAVGAFMEAIHNKVNKVCGTEWDGNNINFVLGRGFEVKKNVSEYTHQFDHIFMFHVLEHLNDPIGFLRTLTKHLSENGKLYIEVPNVEDALLKTYNLQEFSDFYYQSAHLWYFNRQSLDFVLRNAGYKVDIRNIQRYDISNHLQWLNKGIPGGQGIYTNILTHELNLEYVRCLDAVNQTDTIWAICSKN